MIKINHNISVSIWVWILCLGLASCGESYLYDQEIEIPEDTWMYNQPLQFEFQVEDTSKYYNLYIAVKHDKEYSHQNAYAKLKITYPNGQEKQREVSFELADARGKWLGDCQGKYCISKLAYNANGPMRFEQSGNFKMHFEQYTRQDSLKGLSSLRLMLEKADLEELKR